MFGRPRYTVIHWAGGNHFTLIDLSTKGRRSQWVRRLWRAARKYKRGHVPYDAVEQAQGKVTK